MSDLLTEVLAGRHEAFALLHRPQTTGPDVLELLVGRMSQPDTLDRIPMPDASTPGPRHEVLVVMPYRQIAERGYTVRDDGAPLLAMTVTRQATLPLAPTLARLPDVPTELAGAHFDIDDEGYADLVRQVVTEAIGAGEGANFVLKRSFVADITGYGPRSAPAFYRRLLGKETGGYWTFLVHTGRQTFVGASPERHVSLRDGVAVMNPISGTYRYPRTGPTLREVMEFLADRKEAEELYMVVDEELKMMARICPDGGRVIGPYLKEMARLAHTEYLIEGRSDRDVREILRETLFAPTVTGSPVESACRVIARYEPAGRGYYSGVAALIGRDADGGRLMDSAILIRTAEIDAGGRLRIGVGATLVRHSDPHAEAAETRAKAAGLIDALRGGPGTAFAADPQVRAALARRNDTIADFWLRDTAERGVVRPDLAGRRVLVVDAEDTFTAMIANLLRSSGPQVTVRRFDEDYSVGGYDLVVLGPGPGDPAATGDPRMDRLRATLELLLDQQRPFLAVCLSHQVLGLRLGLPLRRRPAPNQGVQKKIDLFGRTELVGFYNTFAVHRDGDEIEAPGIGPVRVSRDHRTGEVHALHGPHFASVQFHPESVLTRDGRRILTDLVGDLLRVPAR